VGTRQRIDGTFRTIDASYSVEKEKNHVYRFIFEYVLITLSSILSG
jgi:hypothetical protein